jgi:tetratricopeptide (TPR) repeat protein
MLAACLLTAAIPASGAEIMVPATGAEIMEGFGPVHHPITTSSPEAQKFFDQGLALAYGFNHEEAIRSFERAAALDPKAAMPLWGIALALGPNINLDVDPEREKKAFDAAQSAAALAASAPEREQAYVRAVARRYTDDPKGDLKARAEDYAKAMGDLSRKYPDDLDAATLYAESLMDLRPWKLWKPDGSPEPGTEEIVSVLESVLKRDPSHLGANHYYIHAVEASSHPERALASAGRLKTLAPASGHLVHMPAHIYMRTGDYAGAITANQRAADVDRAYIARTHAEGIYPLMYYNHNLQFLAAAAMMQGRRAEAQKAADELAGNTAPVAREMPMAEFVVPMPLFVELRFGDWDGALAAPDPGLPLAGAIRRFARAWSSAEKGDAAAADRESAAFADARKAVAPDAIWGNNSAADVLALAAATLDARRAEIGKSANALALWKQAVDLEDGLSYDEPPAWYYPVRESWGAALLRAGKPTEAEAIFRDDLRRNPRSPWSLAGLAASLDAQHRLEDARRAEAECRESAGGVDLSVFRPRR